MPSFFVVLLSLPFNKKVMEIFDNKHQVQGVNLASLSETFGSPLYVYDGQKIQNQVKLLQDAFATVNLKIKYATKALSNINILKLLKNAGTGVDAVSIEEVKLCLHAGFEPSEIMYTPSGVGLEELTEAVSAGVVINIDSIPVLRQFGERFGSSVPVCIRLNPHIMAGGNIKISVGHIDSKFGISILQIAEVLNVVRENKMVIDGLHIHTGSDILDAEVFLKGANVLFDLAKDFPDLKFLDFGGGFKVAYKKGDPATDIQEVGEKVSAEFTNFCKSYGRELELWIEPGKFLVSESGYLLVKANVIKNTPNATFIGVDSGLNHLIRPMMYNAYHEVVNLSNPAGSPKKYTIVGYICETDTIAADRNLPEVREGDILAIKNAGAYGFSMSSNYNSRVKPAEVLILDRKPQLIRKRETFDDILRNQVEIDF
jgi:diaminopimelate decarboxylase